MGPFYDNLRITTGTGTRTVKQKYLDGRLPQSLAQILKLLGATYHRGSIRASHLVSPSLILGIPEDFFLSELYNLDVAEFHQWHGTA